MTSRKIINEFQTISTTLIEFKKKALFHVGWELMKDILKKEMMKTIEKLSYQVYSLIEEGIEIKELKSKIMYLLEKLDGYLPTVTHFQHILFDKTKKLVY